jgi:hypothetical protein
VPNSNSISSVCSKKTENLTCDLETCLNSGYVGGHLLILFAHVDLGCYIIMECMYTNMKNVVLELRVCWQPPVDALRVVVVSVLTHAAKASAVCAVMQPRTWHV